MQRDLGGGGNDIEWVHNLAENTAGHKRSI